MTTLTATTCQSWCTDHARDPEEGPEWPGYCRTKLKVDGERDVMVTYGDPTSQPWIYWGPDDSQDVAAVRRLGKALIAAADMTESPAGDTHTPVMIESLMLYEDGRRPIAFELEPDLRDVGKFGVPESITRGHINGDESLLLTLGVDEDHDAITVGHRHTSHTDMLDRAISVLTRARSEVARIEGRA